MNWRIRYTIVIAAAVLLAATPAWAQRRGGARGGGGGGGGEDSGSSVKKYDEVIGEDAETDVGLFIVHRIKDDLFYEIPTSALGEDMLWVTSIEQTTAGSAYAGSPVDDRVVRWEQRGDNILLRDVRYGSRADTDDPIAGAVERSNLAPIIKVLPVKAYGKDKAPVIEVTELFTRDVPEFAAGRALGAGSMDSGRSFIERARAFPENVEVEVLASYAPGSGGGGRGAAPAPPRFQRPSSGITAVVQHSMVKLPEDPMTPREHDARVGFFSVGFTDYADLSEHETASNRYVTRWRLEKKDPDAEVSDPVKPIVFYVGRGVPEKWKPFVKAGIEAWQPAFEAAGFSNAIQGPYAPDPHEDPDWDPEDARISTIRWLPSDVENAFGPHVHDPRTGEILEADVRMYHNVMKLVRDWYFVQAAACDERAQKLPMPDDLMGELIQFVVTHEVGHSLGFPHNMKASNSYTVEQLRDPEWTKKNGTAPSIMDYARFNYVAQPGDGAALMPAVGPYDYFAVNWGYRQFADDADVKAELETIVKAQIDDPKLRFGGGGDYTAQTEDLTGDAVEAGKLGRQNLECIVGFLVEATCDEGEDYDLLANMYGELFGQWARELGHVTSVVGGVEEINLWYGDADQRYFPASGDDQREAVAFLVEQVFTTPEGMMNEDIQRRLGPDGFASRLLGQQQRTLGSLLSARRMDRMAELAEGDDDGYAPGAMLGDLREAIFVEFTKRSPKVDLYRRNLQRAFVEQLVAIVDAPSAGSDRAALARMTLSKINGMLKSGDDDVTAAHAADLKMRIADALDQLSD